MYTIGNFSGYTHDTRIFINIALKSYKPKYLTSRAIITSRHLDPIKSRVLLVKASTYFTCF